jgi:hypothetical protein
MSSGFSLKSALSDIHAARDQATANPSKARVSNIKRETVKPQITKDAVVPVPITKTTGKSSRPDYASLKIYVRKETRRKAERKWEDAGGGDVSDLIETLLMQYAGS